MSNTSDAIDQLSQKQYDQFGSTVSDLLMDRLKARIENEKYSVGQSIFADAEDDIDGIEQPEETSDEEV